jgi:hypothetical protein
MHRQQGGPWQLDMQQRRWLGSVPWYATLRFTNNWIICRVYRTVNSSEGGLAAGHAAAAIRFALVRNLFMCRPCSDVSYDC